MKRMFFVLIIFMFTCCIPTIVNAQENLCYIGHVNDYYAGEHVVFYDPFEAEEKHFFKHKMGDDSFNLLLQKVDVGCCYEVTLNKKKSTINGLTPQECVDNSAIIELIHQLSFSSGSGESASFGEDPDVIDDDVEEEGGYVEEIDNPTAPDPWSPGCIVTYRGKDCPIPGKNGSFESCTGAAMLNEQHLDKNCGLTVIPTPIDCRVECARIGQPGGYCDYYLGVCKGRDSARCFCGQPPVR